MKKIFENAKSVLVWLGPDNEEPHARRATDSIIAVSDFLFDKLGLAITEKVPKPHTYQELVLKSRSKLPLPNECGTSYIG